jgi:hypothetical protein
MTSPKDTHNERYELLQQQYFSARDTDQKSASTILGEMYEVCVEISTNYINKYQKSRGLHLDVNELSHVAALFIIEQYLRKPEFKILKLSGYIHFGCLKALFKDSEREKREVSWDALAEKKCD